MPVQTTSPLALVPSPGESSIEPDPVPAPARAVIELFATHLAKVQFPDVDAAALAALAAEVRAEAAAVARARDALTAALAASDARVAKLTAACTRAVAYARVFSEAQPERTAIADALAALDAPAQRATAPSGKRRGRPPKIAPAGSDELFDAARMQPARKDAGEMNPPIR